MLELSLSAISAQVFTGLVLGLILVLGIVPGGLMSLCARAIVATQAG